MKTISATAILKNDIQQLKDKQAYEWILLKTDLLNTYENLKPLNILKSTLEEASASQGIGNNYLSSVMGLTAGLLSNVLLPGGSFSPAKGIFSTLLQLGVSDVVTKNMQTIRLLVNRVTGFFNSKQETKTENL